MHTHVYVYVYVYVWSSAQVLLTPLPSSVGVGRHVLSPPRELGSQFATYMYIIYVYTYIYIYIYVYVYVYIYIYMYTYVYACIGVHADFGKPCLAQCAK